MGLTRPEAVNKILLIYLLASYRKVFPNSLQSLKGVRSGVKMLVSLWNLAGASPAVPSTKFQSNWKIQPRISCLKGFARSYDNISCDTETAPDPSVF